MIVDEAIIYLWMHVLKNSQLDWMRVLRISRTTQKFHRLCLQDQSIEALELLEDLVCKPRANNQQLYLIIILNNQQEQEQHPLGQLELLIIITNQSQEVVVEHRKRQLLELDDYTKLF